MPLTEVQRGDIGQTEAAKYLMISSNGDVECDNPQTDDERRDVETHRGAIFWLRRCRSKPPGAYGRIAEARLSRFRLRFTPVSSLVTRASITYSDSSTERP
jgi:hypothetical protein